MAPLRARVPSRRGAEESSVDGNPGRHIFSDRQWLSLARSLGLSSRELEIIQCVFDDQIEQAMALELGISVHTIHTYLERLYRKLGVGSRCAAVIRVFAEHFDQHSPGGVAGRRADGSARAEGRCAVR